MKAIATYFIGILFFIASGSVSAQDWAKVSAEGKKILVDTTYVRAMEVTLKPGEKDKMHTHPAHFFYALTDGQLTVHYADGKNEVYDMKAGDNGYSDPERPHWTENTGTAPITFLIVELKEHPFKAMKPTAKPASPKSGGN